MSQKRIKTIKKKKANKQLTRTINQAFSIIKQDKDKEVIENLIIEDKLDPSKIDNYKYMRSIAGNIEWPIHRLFKAVESAKVKEAIKKESENTNEKN